MPKVLKLVSQGVRVLLPDKGFADCCHAGADGAKSISDMSSKVCCYHPGMQTVDRHLEPGPISWTLGTRKFSLTPLPSPRLASSLVNSTFASLDCEYAYRWYFMNLLPFLDIAVIAMCDLNRGVRCSVPVEIVPLHNP